MLLGDAVKFTLRSITAHRLRSGLTGLGIAIGITAVVLLTSIGEGIRHFVLTEFTQFGTHLIAINPGKTVTHGTPIGTIATVRPLSIADATALATLSQVRAVVPVVQGNAEAEYNGKRRRTNIYGVGPDMPTVFRFTVGSGRFLPADNPQAPRAFAVLGSKVRSELFGTDNPLGQRIRIANSRFMVIGTMEHKGQVLGFDMDEAVYIPAGKALELFNRESLMEIDVLYSEGAETSEISAGIRRILNARHGSEDYTITTQEQMLDTLGSVLDVLTFAVGALGGISLLVGGVGILTIMTITVSERTAEIGLLRALGARRIHILGLFLSEAIILSSLGGAVGLILGTGGGQLLHLLVPALPVHTSWFYVMLAEGLAAAIGLLAGVMPARHAAQLDPVEALRAE
jgi:putative ABC transport system permease protein